MNNFLKQHWLKMLFATMFVFILAFLIESLLNTADIISFYIAHFLKQNITPIILAFVFAIIAAIILEQIFKPFRRLVNLIRKKIVMQSAENKFEHKYREWLINKYRLLNVRGIRTNTPVSIELERVFISLKMKRAPERIKFTEIEKIYELKDLFFLPLKRLIIFGAPGSGKTTLLKYLTLKFARKKGMELFGIEEAILPISINLRDIEIEWVKDVKKFADNYKKYIDVPNCPEYFFEKRFEEGRCIFLLDGLDEVAKEEEREEVAKWVDRLATTYFKNVFFITSRPFVYETTHLYINFLEFHIQDFTAAEVEDFIRYWTRAVEIEERGDTSEFTLREAEKNAEGLIEAIKKNPKIRALTVKPLLLTIVSLVHRYRAHLPEMRVSLYEECCDVLLGMWDKAKGITGGIHSLKKIAILQPLAFYLHQTGSIEEKREKIIELLENELPKIGIHKDKASDFLDDIRYRCGILVETKLGYFGFAHQTFQEYLAARYIKEKQLEGFLAKRKKDSYWLEVTLLYCGMTDSTSLLKEILKETKETDEISNLLLAGRCLAESLSISPDLRDEITYRLSNIDRNKIQESTFKEMVSEILEKLKAGEDSLVAKKTTEKSKYNERNFEISSEVSKKIEHLKNEKPRTRWEASLYLGAIKAKGAVRPLIEVLRDKVDFVRAGAARALGQIQGEEAVPHLIELLNDKESVVRCRSAEALGNIQAKEAVSPLIELLKDKESDVRERAAYALGKIGDINAVESLKLLIKDTEYSHVGECLVRDSVLRAVKEISERTRTII